MEDEAMRKVFICFFFTFPLLSSSSTPKENLTRRNSLFHLHQPPSPSPREPSPASAGPFLLLRSVR